MISGSDVKIEPRQRGDDLNARYLRLHGDMVDQLAQTAINENHGLVYTLVGWEHWIACAAANYLIEMMPVPAWLHIVPWLVWSIVALLTFRLVRGRSLGACSPLATRITLMWFAFFLLAGSVVALNWLAGLPLFMVLPVLAILAAFAFGVLAILVSRRFLPAVLLMVAAGFAIALMPSVGFLLYGTAWLIILEALGHDLLRKRRAWLAEEQYRSQVLPFTRLGS